MKAPKDPKSVRFNEEEWTIHEALKDFFGIRDTHGEDAATLKTAETVCYNVLHNLFGRKLEQIFRRKATAENVLRRQEEQQKREKSITNTDENHPILYDKS